MIGRLLSCAAVTLALVTAAADHSQDTEGQSPADLYWSNRLFKRELAGGNEEELTPCFVDTDCPDHPWQVCGIKEAGFCGHKGVFPVFGLEIGGILLFAAVMALSNIAGIGGGGVAIPIIMAMFNFTTKPAIAISSFSIFATTVARFAVNFKERHPDKDNATVIDYDLVTIMMPTTLAGAQIGALILVVFPSLFIQIILTLMLLFLAIQGACKAVSITKKENAANLAKKVKELEMESKTEAVTPGAQTQDAAKANQAKLNSIAPSELVNPPVQTDGDADEIKAETEPQASTNREDDTAKIVEQNVPKSENETLSDKFDKELKLVITDDMDPNEIKRLRQSVRALGSHCQFAKLFICFFLLILLIFMNLCMGTKSNPSIIGLEKCGLGYWLIQIGFLVTCVIFTVISVKISIRDQNLKLKYGGIGVADSDIRFSNGKRLSVLLMLGFAGGLVAGALGLGGGSVYNPALLAMGIPPKVSSATGLYLVTFSKIASVLVYFLNDQLDIGYGLWIGLWSCVGMLGGFFIAQWYMKKSGRQSIIVWCLVVIFCISVVAIPIFGGTSLKKEVEEGLDLWAFNSLCDVK